MLCGFYVQQQKRQKLYSFWKYFKFKRVSALNSEATLWFYGESEVVSKPGYFFKEYCKLVFHFLSRGNLDLFHSCMI
jgi:hypothetical protein